MNTPGYKKYIGDRGVDTEQKAADYIRTKLIPSYEHEGFGFYIARLRHMDFPIGLVGMVQRDVLDLPDLGFAFLDEYWGMGYAEEACRGVMDHAANELLISTLQAVTTDENTASTKLLVKLGFRKLHTMSWYDTTEVSLFECDLD